jgi:putative redox protein
MDMTISFPGGKRVDAEYDGFRISTDQGKTAGGEGSAPEPFSLFLASIGTCAGIYVLSFCQNRNIPTDGISIVQSHEKDPETKKLTKLTIDIRVPPSFPEKYLSAVRAAADGCKVKKTIAAPPEFVIESHVTAG